MVASLIVWAMLCPIAATMADLITFEEYRRHFPDRARAVREALRTAIYTLVVFAVLGVAVTAIMGWMVH